MAASICRIKLGPGLAAHCSPLQGRAAAQRARGRQGTGAQQHQAKGLIEGSRALEGSLGPLPSLGRAGLSAASGRPLIPRKSGQGLGWSMGYQPLLRGPYAQAYLLLSSTPASPQRLPSCLWQEAVVSAE